MKRITTLLTGLLLFGSVAMAQQGGKMLIGTWTNTVNEDGLTTVTNITFNEDLTYSKTIDYKDDGIDETEEGTYQYAKGAMVFAHDGTATRAKGTKIDDTTITIDFGEGPLTYTKVEK